MTKRRAIIGGVVMILLLGVAGWAFGLFSGTDPAIADLQQIGSKMWDRSLPDAERNQLRGEFRQRMDSLTPDQRRAFFDASRDQWTGRAQQRMDEYFAMSKADQQKRLDEILDRIVKGRASQQQSATGANQQNAQQNQAKNGGPGGSRGASGSRGPRDTSAAAREERSKRRLDRTTPAMRAQFTEFRKQLDTRAQQRGISLGDQRGWGMPGFGGGRRGA